VALVLTAIWATGCATKKYVREQVQPVSTKVDQVQTETQKQGTQIQQTNQQLEKDETAISAAKEIATSADTRAGQALTQGGQNSKQLGELRNVIANLEDYKVANQTVVHFGFNKDNVTTDDQQQLDQLAGQIASAARYFITVEGYTDQTGPASYNEELSRRRANHVIAYLVGSHNIPIYRIHTVGLGDQKLIDAGKTRQARAESRRVEVVLYSAPPLPGKAATTQ